MKMDKFLKKNIITKFEITYNMGRLYEMIRFIRKIENIKDFIAHLQDQEHMVVASSRIRSLG